MILLCVFDLPEMYVTVNVCQQNRPHHLNLTDNRCAHCRSSNAENLEFNLRELTESKEIQASKKKPAKTGRQFDGRFGVGDTVTVMASRTDAENKVSTFSLRI